MCEAPWMVWRDLFKILLLLLFVTTVVANYFKHTARKADRDGKSIPERQARRNLNDRAVYAIYLILAVTVVEGVYMLNQMPDGFRASGSQL